MLEVFKKKKKNRKGRVTPSDHNKFLSHKYVFPISTKNVLFTFYSLMLILTIFLRIHHSFFFPIAFLSHCDKLLIIIRDLSKKRLTISIALTRLSIS